MIGNDPYLRITSKHNRTIVVGDIHGCFGELMKIIEIAEFSSDDVLVSVGDMVDRGPESYAVTEYFRNTPNAFAAMGNHERRLAGSIRGTAIPAWAQMHSMHKTEISKHEAWAGFLENLPAVIETDHAVITHARLNHADAINEQESYFTAAVGGPHEIIEINRVLRLT